MAEEIEGTGAQILMFADDSKIFRIVENEHDKENLQNAIDKIEAWSKNNHLTLNASTTFHLPYLSQK